MQRSFDRGMLAVIGLLVALIAVNAAIAYYNIVDLYQARVRVGTSRQVQASLKDLLSSVKDAEAGLRGYVITGDESHLKHFFAARGSVNGFVKRIDEMTRGNPAQQDRLPMLRQRIEERLLELNYTLEVMRAKGFAPARDILMTDWGKITMDALRAEIESMLAEEARVLEARNTVSLQGMDIAHASSIFAALLGLLMVGALVLQMRRNFIARDRSAAVLGDQRELFRTTLASLLEAVVTTDMQGRITYMNESAATLTGWRVEDAVGKPVGEVVRVVDDRLRQPVENSAQRALREERDVPVAQRFHLVDRTGEGRLPIDDSAAPIRDPQGHITGAVLVFRDISQRKRSQDALVEADRRKDEFLAVLAHELRNPLAPLRNALQIVRMANHDPATVRQLWGMMERQIHQMVRLIDDLLDVSRITRGKLQLRKEPVEIASVVESALEMSAPILERAKHAIEVSIPDGRHVVEGDRARLVQVIDNLVTNAAKYTDSGGRIRLSVEAVDGQLCIRVKDNGIGIPKEMLERVFDMFTQVDRTLERSRGGLGIGLTLVRRIVELHGGTVVARSEGAGRGSEFSITLPRVEADAPVLPAAPFAAHTGASHRILVVDDNRDAASSLMETLQLMGHDVRAAFDGLECLREAEHFRPEMVFLDIGMPRLNGFDTAKRLRGEPWARQCLLVAVTGWGQDEDRRRAREAGFDHHLVKPIDFDALNAIIAGFPARKRPAMMLEKVPHGGA